MKYIGIDGGGTKTKFTLFDDDGKIINEVTHDTVHILQKSDQECIDTLSNGVIELLNGQNKDVVVIAGLAGYGQELAMRERIEGICEIAFKGYQYLILNDVQIAIAGALDNKDGIVIIAGTGSIGLSMINNQEKRCGGFGYVLGDEASAYWIAKKMLNIFTKQIDGRIAKSILYDEMIESCNLENDYDIISYVNKTLFASRNGIASLAKITYQAALKGDLHAIEIYNKAALEIAKLIQVLAKDFDDKITISYIGGVFNAKQFILPPLKNHLSNLNYDLIAPKYSPEYGAYLLGKKKFK